jgi:hypothetical protein
MPLKGANVVFLLFIVASSGFQVPKSLSFRLATARFETSSSRSEQIELLRKERDRRRDALIAAEIALLELEKIDGSPRDRDTIIVPPAGGIVLFGQTFKTEVSTLLLSRGSKVRELDPIVKEIKPQLKLSNKGIMRRERARPKIVAPLVIKLPYNFLCFLLDSLFDSVSNSVKA